MDNFVSPASNCLPNSTDLEGTFCNVTSDSVTCWAQTLAGNVAKQPCPAIFGARPGTFAYKRCGLDGMWTKPQAWKGFGYSDYSECIGHLSMIEDIFDIDKDKLKEIEKEEIIDDKPESIVFLVLTLTSLSFLLTSLFIVYCVIPKRLNQAPNYKIWRHFFMAVIFEMLLKGVSLISVLTCNKNTVLTISPLCETLITGAEYMNIASYMWFMIVGHFQQLNAQSGRLCTSGYVTYILIGWGIPTIPIAIWSVTLSLSYKVPCWQKFEFQPTIWIVETARNLFLLMTLLFLINAFRRMSKNSEMLSTNCCYRRLYLETVGSAFFSVFVISISLSKALLYRSGPPERHVFDILCQVVSSLKGAVMCLLMLSFNSDVRGILEKNVRRISRQEFVLTPVEESTF